MAEKRLYEKEELIIEGKTKKVYGVKGESELVIIENKDDTTAFNDPKFTKQISGKAEFCTSVTCRIFELLKQVGISVAYVCQSGPCEFVAKKTNMIPLECIGRRLAIGSYLDRYPWEKQDPPKRFHRMKTEYFLKTTNGELVIGGKKLVEGLSTKEDDPFIINPASREWRLFHPHKPSFDDRADLAKTISSSDILLDVYDPINGVDRILRRCFLFLEGLFSVFGYRFADFKIEFGMTKSKKPVISDVIDPDSWRLLTHDWHKFSKQAFRDGEGLDEVAKKYGVLSRMSEFFRIPRQALVVWTASKDDKFEWPDLPVGVELVKIVNSGHKETGICLEKLENIMRDFPDGGVIVDKVGRSNGLGPTLATHTPWQVISVPADWKEKPQNVWSHLDMPSQNPMATILYDNNAILAALGILAQKNPAAYMERQLAIEELDK